MSIFGLASVSGPDGPVLAATQGGRVHAIAELLPDAPTTFADALADWEAFVDAVEKRLEATSPTGGRDAAEVEFLVPGVARPTVWCAGANYSDHVAEMGVTDFEARAFHFLSPASVLNAHRGTVVRPAGVEQFDWEVELAAVIGWPSRGVARADALACVAGYAVANDVSVRDPGWMRHPIFGMDWTAAKNADGLTPLGPSIVPARFVPDPSHLELQLTVNGTVRQQSTTARMIVDLSDQICALTRLITLQPGDLILTGTPAGTAAGHDNAFLEPGDVMVASITHLDSLESTVA